MADQERKLRKLSQEALAELVLVKDPDGLEEAMLRAIHNENAKRLRSERAKQAHQQSKEKEKQ